MLGVGNMKKLILLLVILIALSGIVSAVQCNDTIVQNTTLTEDLVNCNGTFGIKIGANNIILDCDGHPITGGNAYSGIHVISRQRVMIVNCNVSGFQNGINLAGSTENILYNNHADNNGQNGFFIGYSSNDNRLVNNTANNN